MKIISDEPYGDLRFTGVIEDGKFFFEDEEGTAWTAITLPYQRSDLKCIPRIPDKPSGTLALISAVMTRGMTGKTNDIAPAMDFVFEDGDGHHWKTDHMPCFRHDMIYVPNIEEFVRLTTAEPSKEYISAVLSVSSDDYWQPIVDEVEAAGREVRFAGLTNHQGAHLLFWANIARKSENEPSSDYWERIVSRIISAGQQVRNIGLLNHEAAHLLMWAEKGRNAALV